MGAGHDYFPEASQVVPWPALGQERPRGLKGRTLSIHVSSLPGVYQPPAPQGGRVEARESFSP